MTTQAEHEVLDFDEESDPQLAVVFMDPDDAAWWRIVADHAMEYEWRYDLDTTTEPVTEPDSDTYDPALVLAWVRRHVEPPRWEWHGPAPEAADEYDDERIPFASSAEPRDGYRSGAIISLVVPPGGRPA